MGSWRRTFTLYPNTFQRKVSDVSGTNLQIGWSGHTVKYSIYFQKFKLDFTVFRQILTIIAGRLFPFLIFWIWNVSSLSLWLCWLSGPARNFLRLVEDWTFFWKWMIISCFPATEQINSALGIFFSITHLLRWLRLLEISWTFCLNFFIFS